MAKLRTPAIDGWFTLDASDPHLLGTRCRSCGTIAFPKEASFCRNPHCPGTAFDEVPLSSRGRLWSFTDNRYPPPAPFVASDPFEPYAIAAVELEREKMVVLGQVAKGFPCSGLAAGMEMELVLEPLYEDDDREFVVWKWRPAHGA